MVLDLFKKALDLQLIVKQIVEVLVVNIDNGFGAGASAALIANKIAES